jgi:hypothetical protein
LAAEQRLLEFSTRMDQGGPEREKASRRLVIPTTSSTGLMPFRAPDTADYRPGSFVQDRPLPNEPSRWRVLSA